MVFIVCELGQRMTDAFEKIDISMDHLDWYLFPIEIQRQLPMIIVVAQQSVLLESFGSIGCTREVFKNVRTKKIINRQLVSLEFVSLIFIKFHFRFFVQHTHILRCFVNLEIENN